MENNRQKTVIVAIVALMIVGVIGTTIAFFNSETVFQNQFKTPAHESEFTEEFTSPENWLPGDEEKKEVSVKNTGEYDIAVRISYTEEWIGGDGVTRLPLVQDQDGTEVRAAIINFPNKEDWGRRTEDDGVTYYYYKDILGKDESTSLFMDKVTFNKDITHDETCTNIYTYSDGTTSSGSAPEEGKTVKVMTQRCESTGQTYAGGTYILTIKIETIQWDQYKNGWNIDEDLKDLEWDKTIAGEMKKNAVIDNVASTYVASETGIDFNRDSFDVLLNGRTGIYLRAGTENDKYPIYYYRGELENNHVFFANYCWRILRTTETGGVKLIYNGPKNGNHCYLTSENADNSWTIGASAFNNNGRGLMASGYTYGDELRGTTDSTLKTEIDNWYRNNMLDYTDYLEDTIWCNDRTYVHNDSSPSADNAYNFGTYTRLVTNRTGPLVKGAEACPNVEDRYTVNAVNGNGLLTYPVATITADEALLIGFTPSDSYNINTFVGSGFFWTMTPSHIMGSDYANQSRHFGVMAGMADNTGFVNTDYYVMRIRPSISLSNGVTLTGGDGSATNPYTIAK